MGDDNETARMDLNPRCGAGIDNRRRIQTLEVGQVKICETIEKIRNRLPYWATLLIGGLTGVIGYLFKASAGGG